MTNGSGDEILHSIKCTIGIVSLDGGEATIDLGLTVDALVHAIRGNPRVARKEKGSCVMSGKLISSSTSKC